jgi:hypothetical protein
MADFWGGFGAGFVPSANQAADRYQRGLIAEQEMALRRAADARASEAHTLQMRGARRIDDATERLSTLQRVGAPITETINAQDADFEAADAAARRGLPVAPADPKLWQAPMFRKAGEQEINAGMMDLAAARGDMQGLTSVRTASKRTAEDDLIAKANFSPKLTKWVNLNSQRVTVGKPNKQGFTPLIVVTPDGGTVEKMLSEVDRRVLAGAEAIFEMNPERALQMVGTVDKALAAAMREENVTTAKVTDTNNDVTAKGLAAQNDAARTDIMARESNARTANMPRNVPPELMKKLSDIEQEFISTDDPKVKAQLERQYQMVLSQAGAAIGKPMGLPSRTDRTPPPMSPKDEAQALKDLTDSFGDPTMAQRYLAIRTGRITPEMAAEAVRGDPRELQLEEVRKWQAVDPAFASQLARMLIQPTATQPAGRPGLPPPIQQQAPRAAIPTPQRGSVPPGQAPARLPWESPTSGW